MFLPIQNTVAINKSVINMIRLRLPYQAMDLRYHRSVSSFNRSLMSAAAFARRRKFMGSGPLFLFGVFGDLPRTPSTLFRPETS